MMKNLYSMLLLLFATIGLSSGCGHYFVMDGEVIETLSKSDRVGILVNSKGGSQLRGAVEAAIMAQGVHVQAVHIEDIKDDFYDQKGYDLITDTPKLPRKLEVESTDYASLRKLQAVNDYSMRTELGGSALEFLDHLRKEWSLDYVVIVRESGPFNYYSYAVDTGSKERIFSFYVNANAKGWFRKFPVSKNKPSFEDQDGLSDGEMARYELSRFVADALTNKRR